MASSSSNAQVPSSSANGENGAALVPALPFTVVGGGVQGEDIQIPTDSSHADRSRSTPEHALNPAPPPGLAPRAVSQTNVRQQQLHYSVRQEVASIEQKLMQLQHIQQQQQQNMLMQQQQQNNFVQVNMDNPQTSDVARQALEVQQQAIQHAQQMQANANAADQRAAQAMQHVHHVQAEAQAANQRAAQVAHQAQAHTEHIILTLLVRRFSAREAKPPNFRREQHNW